MGGEDGEDASAAAPQVTSDWPEWPPTSWPYIPIPACSGTPTRSALKACRRSDKRNPTPTKTIAILKTRASEEISHAVPTRTYVRTWIVVIPIG